MTSKLKHSADSIELLIRARYPLLYVVSWEEERALEEIRRVSASLGKVTYDWTILQGLSKATRIRMGTAEGQKGTRDPIVALREVLNIGEAAVFVFRDFHNFVKDSSVKRALRDLASALRSTLSSVIILSPILDIPTELEKDVVIFDFPLPDRADIERLIEQAADETRVSPTLHVDTSPESRAALVDAAIGLTLNEAENVLSKTLVRASRLSAEQAPLVYAEKKQIVRKAGLLEYIESDESLQTVGGLDRLKDWLGLRRLAMEPSAREFGLPAPRGVLLVGVQGCGKSLAAKATAAELRYPLLRMDIGRLFSKMLGDTEQNMRYALGIAEAVAPVVLWVDEIEKGLSGVASGGNNDGGTASRLFGTFITWMQEKTAPVFVVATANEIEQLPPEVLRKGRFDEIFFVDLPAETERNEILIIHIQRRRRNPGTIDTARIAAASDGFSGAELEQLIIEGLFLAYEQQTDLTTEHLMTVVARTVPLSQTMRQSVARRRTWAIGRTVNASAASDLITRIEREDPVEDQKVALFAAYTTQMADVTSDTARRIEDFLGPFPGKSEDLETIRVYIANAQRIAEHWQRLRP